MFNKLLKLSVFILVGFSAFLLFPANAQTVAPTTTPIDPCYEPTSTVFNTQPCVEKRLGLTQIDAGKIIIKRDPTSLVVVAFRVFLYFAVLATVARIVWVGIQIGGTKDDAEKRTELLSQLIWIVVGLVVALGALGITFVVQQWFFGRTFEDQIVQCKDLDTLPATQQTADLKVLCAQYIQNP